MGVFAPSHELRFPAFRSSRRLRRFSALLYKTAMSQTATRAGARHGHSFDLKQYLETRSEAVNRALDKFLPSETTAPATIHKAMRYSLFAGGKRMRPALCLGAAEACGGDIHDAMPLACAVECIHTYSLIHDD